MFSGDYTLHSGQSFNSNLHQVKFKDSKIAQVIPN